jgi:predicted XRE-type DNA-binding protein
MTAAKGSADVRRCFRRFVRYSGGGGQYEGARGVAQRLGPHVKSWDLSQEAAAARLGVTRPRLNDLMRGKLGKFSLDALVNLTTAAGLEREIRVKAAA